MSSSGGEGGVEDEMRKRGDNDDDDEEEEEGTWLPQSPMQEDPPEETPELPSEEQELPRPCLGSWWWRRWGGEGRERWGDRAL